MYPTRRARADNEKHRHIRGNRMRRDGRPRAESCEGCSSAALALLVGYMTITGLVEVGASGNANNPASRILVSSLRIKPIPHS